uniref:SLC26A/SulP transporter domain-containing protein n=1 Tax=Panagrolaimus superbus TaxID=310955 RepID=A0A914XTF4_9BILA
MAYAALAGVPAIVGLYSSFFPPLLYLLFGTSRHISLGMFAVIALMTGTVEQKLRTNSTSEISHSINQSVEGNEAVEIITALTFSIGIVLAIMAICQIHFVSAYLSDELTAGFTTGAACHVLWSQIPQIFAIKIPNQNGIFNLFRKMYDFCSKIGKTNFAALFISICCILFLYIGKIYLNPMVSKKVSIPIPFELIVVVFTTILSNFMDFHGLHNVTVVGKIPTGLPIPTLPSLNRIGDTFPDAIIIAIVIYAISFSVAKLFAKKHHYNLNPAQEVRALAAQVYHDQ